MMRACDVMTTRVAGIHPKATLAQAIALMADFNLTTLPVVDISGTLVGMLTGSDILRRTWLGATDDLTESRTAPGLRCGTETAFADSMEDGCVEGTHLNAIDLHWKAYDQAVEDVMTPEICFVRENTPLSEVAQLVRSRQVKRLPVLNGDKIVGIIGCDEVAKTLGKSFDCEPEAEMPADAAIRKAVLNLLHQLSWTPSPLIDILVDGGRIELHGTLLRHEERAPLRLAIETIPGVVRYTDYLVLAEAPRDILPPASAAARRLKLYC
jgi:CBS domain-containing protein